MHRILSVALLLTIATANVQAACEARSGTQRTHLVELYTSEGCNSCPPAEHWMSSLVKHAELIGLEFHVDYWDSNEFHDPFADHAYTVRQQMLAKRDNHGQSYTPQIWLDGRLWYNWPRGSPPEPVNATPPALSMSAENGADTLHLKVDAEHGGADADYRIYAALTENGLSEHVRGGENRGKTLSHDEVVRAFAGPFELPHADIDLKVPPRLEPARSSMVAFVQDNRDGSIVQAIRMPVSECRK
jgi:hypothetical protein